MEAGDVKILTQDIRGFRPHDPVKDFRGTATFAQSPQS